MSAYCSATTSFYHKEPRHLTLYFLGVLLITSVHFMKVTIWLKLTVKLVLEWHRPFWEELQVGKHYFQCSQTCPDLTGYDRSRKIFCSSELTFHIGNDTSMCPIHPHPAVLHRKTSITCASLSNLLICFH